MTKVLICGYTGHSSCGDEGIIDRVVRLIGKSVTLITDNCENVSRMHGTRTVARYDFVSIVREMSDSDLLILGGGTLLQKRTSYRSLLYYSAITQAAATVGLPYVIYGGLDDRSAVTKRVVADASRLYLRDSHSMKIAAAMGARDKCVFAPDPVLIPIKREGEQTGRYLVCSPRFDDLRSVGAAAAYARRAGLTAVYAAMHPSDRGACVRSAMKYGGIAAINDDFTRLEELIKGAELAISSRLHTCVIAYSARIPFVAFSEDPKIRAFAHDAGMDRACVSSGGAQEIEKTVNGFDFSRLRSLQKLAYLGLKGIRRSALGSRDR